MWKVRSDTECEVWRKTSWDLDDDDGLQVPQLPAGRCSTKGWVRVVVLLRLAHLLPTYEYLTTGQKVLT